MSCPRCEGRVTVSQRRWKQANQLLLKVQQFLSRPITTTREANELLIEIQKFQNLEVK